jgi:phytoene dehydrogenase-like protein
MAVEDSMSPMSRRVFVKGATLAPLAMTSLPAMGQQTARAPGDRFDIVVAGAGHNSLVCAAYLAKAGNRVLVLEGRPTIGGGCKTQEVCLPGFKEDLCSSVHGGIRTSPIYTELSLKEYGLEYLEPDPVMHIPFLDGASITVWRDVDRTAESIAKISKKDSDTFRRLVPELRNSQAESALEPSEPLLSRPDHPAALGSVRIRRVTGSMKASICARPISPPVILAACPAVISAQAARLSP